TAPFLTVALPSSRGPPATTIAHFGDAPVWQPYTIMYLPHGPLCFLPSSSQVRVFTVTVIQRTPFCSFAVTAPSFSSVQLPAPQSCIASSSIASGAKNEPPPPSTTNA